MFSYSPWRETPQNALKKEYKNKKRYVRSTYFFLRAGADVRRFPVLFFSAAPWCLVCTALASRLAALFAGCAKPEASNSNRQPKVCVWLTCGYIYLHGEWPIANGPHCSSLLPYGSASSPSRRVCAPMLSCSARDQPVVGARLLLSHFASADCFVIGRVADSL